MKTLLPLVVFTAAISAHADDATRSAAYQASNEQARIFSTSGSVVTELDAILGELSRNGISNETKELIEAARTNLASAREGSISTALAELREISTSGKSEDVGNVVRQQQEAEIALRRIASKLAEKRFTDEVVAMSSAIIARQEIAAKLEATGKNPTGVAAEQQAIALQVQDLAQAISSTPEELSPQTAAVIKQASEKAKALDLTAKADAAANSSDVKARQQELRDALAQVDEVLNKTVSAKERLEQAVKDVEKMKKEQATLAANPKPDPAKSDALANQAEATARKVASESPAADNALKKASDELQANTPQSQADASKTLAEASTALKEQLAREKAAEKTSLANAAEDLKQMAAEATQLAAAERAAAQSPTGADREAIKDKAESLQSRAAPLSPDAASDIAQARSEMKSNNSAAAASSLEKSAEKLTAQAGAAQAAAAEEARINEMKDAIAKAAETNKTAGESMKPGQTGDAAGQAMKSQAQIAELPAQAAKSALEAAQQGQQGSSEAIKEAGKATAKAADSEMQSAQSAAGGNLPNAKEANKKTSDNLADANNMLAQRQADLRAQAGMPSEKLGSPTSREGGFGGSSSTGPEGTEITNRRSGSAGEVQTELPPAVRQAMAELRKTPVPSEYSGTVQAYFEQLAKQ